MEQAKDKLKEDFFCEGQVEKGGYTLIEIRFQTLINANCESPFDWYKDLGLDKSYASKVRRGLIIPPKWMRIKIAGYFKTDSMTIWPTPTIVSADRYIPLKEWVKKNKERLESGEELKGRMFRYRLNQKTGKYQVRLSSRVKEALYSY